MLQGARVGCGWMGALGKAWVALPRSKTWPLHTHPLTHFMSALADVFQQSRLKGADW